MSEPKPARKPEAEAQCVVCKHREWFTANDPRITPGMCPFCPKCHNPMASTGKVRVR